MIRGRKKRRAEALLFINNNQPYYYFFKKWDCPFFPLGQLPYCKFAFPSRLTLVFVFARFHMCGNFMEKSNVTYDFVETAPETNQNLTDASEALLVGD